MTTTDVLTREQVAAWLQVHPRQIERLGVPCLSLGVRTKRYLRTDVEAWMVAKKGTGAQRGAVPQPGE
jgi:hypothetical protein